MSREYVSTKFDGRRISVIVHRSSSDKLAVAHSSCLFGAESYSGEREKKSVSGKVFNQRFVNSCLANSPSVYCCGATVGSEQQHNQDLRKIYKGRRILEFLTFYHNALHLTTLFTTMHCI